MRSEPGEQREFLAAHQDIHRIDLDDPHLIEHATQVTSIDPAGGTGIGETLRRERDTSSVGEGEVSRQPRW